LLPLFVLQLPLPRLRVPFLLTVITSYKVRIANQRAWGPPHWRKAMSHNPDVIAADPDQGQAKGSLEEGSINATALPQSG
jgi:hypothetical protein